MINGDWFSKPLMDSPEDVHVRQCRFYHHDVRSFIDVESYLAQGFLGIGNIHLVRAPITKLRRAFRSLAKRSVEGRCKLGRVTHNGSLVEARGVERRANRADAAIHHVTRRHNVCAGCSVRERRLRQQLDSLVVEHVEMVSIDARHAAVAMTRVLAQADVGDGDKIRAF